MKSKWVLLLSLISCFSISACVPKGEPLPEPQPVPEEPEEYIEPTKPDGEPDDQGGEVTPPEGGEGQGGEGGEGGGEEIPPEPVEPVYDEPADDASGIDTSDFSSLYNAFDNVGDNYTSTIKGYFNQVGGYDYYRHYQKNYVCDKTSFYTEDVKYTLPDLNDYLPVCNTGYINLNDNYYSFSLKGDTKEERLAYSLTNEDLSNEVADKKYQDDAFTLNDLDQTYFEANEFVRVSANKYQSNKREVCEQFVEICATDLINQGYYLTFSKVTIEVNPLEDVALRVRLYVASTQSGKLIDSHKDNVNKPNWYLLFSEAYISNIGTTTFAPASEILK